MHTSAVFSVDISAPDSSGINCVYLRVSAKLMTTLSADTAFATSSSPYSFQFGLWCLVATFVGNGTHSSFAKCAGKDSSPGSPIVYTLYFSCALFCTCSALLPAMGEPFVISWPGILGGALLCFSVTCYITAIRQVGIVWCDMLTASTAAVVSFLWGKLYFQEPTAYATGAVTGLSVMLVGILSISLVLWSRLQKLERTKNIAEGLPLISGLFLSVATGIFGGTCFAANKMQNAEYQGVSFVWTQALGMLGMQILLVLLGACRDLYHSEAAYKKVDSNDLPSTTYSNVVLGQFGSTTAAMLGAMQGMVLALTNLTTTIAGMSAMGIGVAQPVREAGHILAVLIGTLCFHEYGAVDASFLICLLSVATMNVAGMVILIVCGSAPQ